MAKATATGWFQRLEGGRVEIYFKVENVLGAPDMKLRASGEPEHMNELADWFEETTGLRVDAPWRRRPVKVIEGQESLFSVLQMGEVQFAPERESDGSIVD